MDAETGRNHYGAAALIMAALGVSGAPQALAQTDPQAQPRPQSQAQPRPQPGAVASSTGFYAFAGLAAFGADDSAQLTGERSGAALTFGGGYRATPNFAVEVNVLVSGRNADTPASAEPLPGTYAAGTLKSSMGTVGMAASLKFSFPAGRLDPYFGGGGGAYSTKFQTTSEALGCTQNCRDTGPRIEATSRNIGIHALAGADYHITQKDVVGGEMRYLRLTADFGGIVPGQVNAGGLFVWLGYRRYF